ncbi:hypothetical protein PV326_012547 [Microctonus aethiopoides]|nr:hypothetical protein PV326_012547 [Microctonus aethiopoides]
MVLFLDACCWLDPLDFSTDSNARALDDRNDSRSFTGGNSFVTPSLVCQVFRVDLSRIRAIWCMRMAFYKSAGVPNRRLILPHDGANESPVRGRDEINCSGSLFKLSQVLQSLYASYCAIVDDDGLKEFAEPRPIHVIVTMLVNRDERVKKPSTRYTEPPNWPQVGGSQNSYGDNVTQNISTTITGQRRLEGAEKLIIFGQIRNMLGFGHISDLAKNDHSAL